MKAIVGACLLMLLAVSAHAHSDAYFDANPTPHGGQVRMAGAYHFELVVTPGLLTVYVSDHSDTPMATAGASASAVVQSAKGKSEIKLSPAGDNVLRGEGEFAHEPVLRVKLVVTMPGAKPETARFTPLKKKSAAAQ